MSDSAAGGRLRSWLPLVMLVTDRRLAGERPLIDAVLLALEGGVNAVQLRERDLPPRELHELASALRSAMGGQALLFVNDRVDVALAASADGVQLPEHGLTVEAARAISGEGMILGRSVHDPAGARQAQADGADLLVAGHLFETASHAGEPPLGEDGFRRIRAATDLPLLAIGGISETNAGDAIAWGADGVATVSALLSAADVRAAACRLRRVVDERYARRQP